MSFAECSIHDYRCAGLQVKVATTLKNPAIRFHETTPHPAPIPLKDLLFGLIRPTGFARRLGGMSMALGMKIATHNAAWHSI